VGVYVYLTLVFPLTHSLTDLADKPDDAHKMVNVRVGYEYVSNFIPINICIFELTEKSVASAPVNEKIFVLLVKDKAGVVALGNHSVTRAEHSYFHGHTLPVINFSIIIYDFLPYVKKKE
jgi:hypothetical protein